MNFKYKNNSLPTVIDTISLNRYDKRFLDNIVNNYIQQDKGLTANQSDVVDVILKKYRKQIKSKMHMYYQDLIDLIWENPIVTEMDLQKKTYFKIQDDCMFLAFPFNKVHISEVRELIYDDESNHLNRFFDYSTMMAKARYPFNWYKDEMQWHGPFEPYLFKGLLAFSRKHNINIDESALAIEKEVNSSTKSEWNTQFVEVHDRLYVNNIQESMLLKLNDMNTTDTSMQNIEKYSILLGITPPKEYNYNFQELMISNSKSINAYDLSNKDAVQNLFKYLQNTSKQLLVIQNRMEDLIGWGEERKKDNKRIKMENFEKLGIQATIVKDVSLNDLEKYDTVVSFVGFAHLSKSMPELEKLKFIRVKIKSE